ASSGPLAASCQWHPAPGTKRESRACGCPFGTLGLLPLADRAALPHPDPRARTPGALQARNPHPPESPGLHRPAGGFHLAVAALAAPTAVVRRQLSQPRLLPADEADARTAPARHGAAQRQGPPPPPARPRRGARGPPQRRAPHPV